MDEIKAKEIFDIAQKKFEKNENKSARDLWLQLLDFYPKNLSLLRNISLTYFKQNKLVETEDILKKILDINLKETNALKMLILVLEDQDKITEAKKFIQIGIDNNILSNHWKIKMNVMIPMIKMNKNIIEKFRSDIKKFINEILNDKKNYNFNIDDHLVKPPQFGLSYDQFDNLEINKICFSMFLKIYTELNKTHAI